MGGVGAIDRPTTLVDSRTGSAYATAGERGPESIVAGGGNRFFERAVGQLPAHGQIVTAIPLLHDGFEVVTATGFEGNRAGFLIRFFGPLARVGPNDDIGQMRFVGWVFVAAEK